MYNFKNVSYSLFESSVQYILGQALQTLLDTTLIAQLPWFVIGITATTSSKLGDKLKDIKRSIFVYCILFLTFYVLGLWLHSLFVLYIFRGKIGFDFQFTLAPERRTLFIIAILYQYLQTWRQVIQHTLSWTNTSSPSLFQFDGIEGISVLWVFSSSCKNVLNNFLQWISERICWVHWDTSWNSNRLFNVIVQWISSLSLRI